MTQILLVDDDDQMRDLYKMMLQEDYPDLLEASNGKQAMEVLSQRHKIDLLITDMVMPEQDGLNTILEIKHLYPQIKIIAISGMEEALTKAHFFGADKILTKPLDPQKLSEAISELGF